MTLHNNISIKVCLPQPTSVSISQPVQVETQSVGWWTAVHTFSRDRGCKHRLLRTLWINWDFLLFIFRLSGWCFHTNQIKWLLNLASLLLLFFFFSGTRSTASPSSQSPPQSFRASEAHAEALFLQEFPDHHPQEPASFPGWDEDPREPHQEGGSWSLLRTEQHELHRSEFSDEFNKFRVYSGIPTTVWHWQWTLKIKETVFSFHTTNILLISQKWAQTPSITVGLSPEPSRDWNWISCVYQRPNWLACQKVTAHLFDSHV